MKGIRAVVGVLAIAAPMVITSSALGSSRCGISRSEVATLVGWSHSWETSSGGPAAETCSIIVWNGKSPIGHTRAAHKESTAKWRKGTILAVTIDGATGGGEIGAHNVGEEINEKLFHISCATGCFAPPGFGATTAVGEKQFLPASKNLPRTLAVTGQWVLIRSPRPHYRKFWEGKKLSVSMQTSLRNPATTYFERIAPAIVLPFLASEPELCRPAIYCGYEP